MNYLSQIILVAGIHLLAVMSPGPDFAMIMRSSLVYSRRSGVYSAIGLGAGIAVHVFYSLIGIGLIISRSILLFNTVKLLGAFYLIYIGYKSLRSKPNDQKNEAIVEQAKDMEPFAAFKLGFLTNVLNPKATLFFLSLFTQVSAVTTPLAIKLIMGVEMVVATAPWFSFVAVCLSMPAIRRWFSRVQHRAEKVFGIILIGLGLKVAFSTHK